jgi:membrane-associated phospholipid phosphatase
VSRTFSYTSVSGLLLAGCFALVAILVDVRLAHPTDLWLLSVIEVPRSCSLLWFGGLISLAGSIEATIVTCVVFTLGLAWAGYRYWVLVPWLVLLPTAIELFSKIYIVQPEPAPPAWALAAHCPLPDTTLDVALANSFPSGHALRIAYFAALLATLPRGHCREVVVVLPLIAAAALMAWARVYPGFHWPTDVLGGLLLGGAFGVSVGHLMREKLV